MGINGYLISIAIVGLVIGGVGRLSVPGPDRIVLMATVGVGLASTIVGAIVGGPFDLGLFHIVFELAVSASLVYLVSLSGGQNKRLIAHWALLPKATVPLSKPRARNITSHKRAGLARVAYIV